MAFPLFPPDPSWRGAQRRGHPGADASGPGWPRPFGARHDDRFMGSLALASG